MIEVYKIEAQDLELDEDPGGVPLGEVEWPDGHRDRLPHLSIEWDADASALMEGKRLLHVGFYNPAGGMTSGYMSADLARLTSDVYFTRMGDIDEEQQCDYLRGTFSEALDSWAAGIDCFLPPVPWIDVFLCQRHGLLRGLPKYEDTGYGVSLFQEAEELAPEVVDVDCKLREPERTTFFRWCESNGSPWPRRAAEDPDSPAGRRWRERVDHWQEDW
jgi:hypothetical protein